MRDDDFYRELSEADSEDLEKYLKDKIDFKGYMMSSVTLILLFIYASIYNVFFHAFFNIKICSYLAFMHFILHGHDHCIF